MDSTKEKNILSNEEVPGSEIGEDLNKLKNQYSPYWTIEDNVFSIQIPRYPTKAQQRWAKRLFGIIWEVKRKD